MSSFWNAGAIGHAVKLKKQRVTDAEAEKMILALRILYFEDLSVGMTETE